MGATEWDYL